MTQPGGSDSSADAAEDQGGAGPGTRWVRTDWESVLRDAAPWVNRVGSLIAAGLLLFAAATWWVRARELSNPCGATRLSQAVCDEVPEFLQNLQFVLAVAGIAVAVLLAGSTVFQAVSGRRVPRLRMVATVLAVLGLTWVVVFLVGRLFF